MLYREGKNKSLCLKGFNDFINKNGIENVKEKIENSKKMIYEKYGVNPMFKEED